MSDSRQGRWCVLVLLAAGVSLAQSCANSSEFRSDTASNHDLAILAMPLSGQIGGVPWTAKGAVARAELSTGSTLFVEAYGEERRRLCTEVGALPPSIILTVPVTPGNYPFTHAINATFLVNDASQTNLATSHGRLEVSKLDDGTVEIGLNAEFDEKNRVNGRIAVEVCVE